MLDEPVVKIVNVSKGFCLSTGPRMDVLKNITFVINKQEIIALLGPSGSGKTTLARIIAGLEKPDQGAVIWHTTQRPKPFLVQMVFQNPYAAIYRGMCVEEIIAEPLYIQKALQEEMRNKINETLQSVHLATTEGFKRRYPHELSGGQLQRVAIARALVLNPLLLVPDEPTSMLDMVVQMEILDLLLELREHTGMSMLFICHDQAVAKYMSDKVMRIDHGTLRYQTG